SGFLLAAVPFLVGLGLVRAVALLRRGTGASWHDALGAFLIWQSTALVVARASVQALFAREAEFLRTPKTAEEGRVWDAVKGNPQSDNARPVPQQATHSGGSGSPTDGSTSSARPTSSSPTASSTPTATSSSTSSTPTATSSSTSSSTPTSTSTTSAANGG